METKNTIQVSFVILLILMIIALGLEVFIAFFFERFVSQPGNLFYGEQVDLFIYNSHALENHYIRVLAGFASRYGIAACLACLMILVLAFRKGRKWAWSGVLIISLFVWGSVLIENIPIHNAIIFTIGLLGLLIVMAALMFSAREFWGEKEGINL